MWVGRTSEATRYTMAHSSQLKRTINSVVLSYLICGGLFWQQQKTHTGLCQGQSFGKIYHFLSSKGLRLQSTSLKLMLFCMVSEENPVSWEHKFLSLSHNSFLQVRSFPQHNTFGVPQPSCWARMWSFQHPLQGGCPAQPDSKETIIKMQTFISWICHFQLQSGAGLIL